MSLFYDRQGRPMTLDEWSLAFESSKTSAAAFNQLRRVGETFVSRWHWRTLSRRSYRVSTVWLGVNHAFDNGPPLIFETMVFNHGKRPGFAYLAGLVAPGAIACALLSSVVAFPYAFALGVVAMLGAAWVRDKAQNAIGEPDLQWRYSTEDEARAGHAAACKLVRQGRFREWAS